MGGIAHGTSSCTGLALTGYTHVCTFHFELEESESGNPPVEVSPVAVTCVYASQWFLIMMGIEMGAMVIVKILKTKEIGNRIRISLMLMAPKY